LPVLSSARLESDLPKNAPLPGTSDQLSPPSVDL